MKNDSYDRSRPGRMRNGPRARRAAIIETVAIGERRHLNKDPRSESVALERLTQRLTRILTANPRARHFTVRRIVSALGESPQGPTIALFSAAGVFEAPDLCPLSAIVTGAIGARIAIRRQGVWLPRAVLRRKIPRTSLAKVIRAASNTLELAQSHMRARWRWVFHPAMSVVLGLILFLLAVTSLAPVLGITAHVGPAFVMSIGLAERDGLAVMIGALAGVASLAIAAMTVFHGKRLFHAIRNWLSACFKRLALQGAARLLDRIDQGLGALLRIRWSSLIFLFAADFAGGVDRSVLETRSLRRRVQRIRADERQRARDDVWS